MQWFQILQAALSILTAAGGALQSSGIFHGGAAHTVEAVNSSVELANAATSAMLGNTSVQAAVEAIIPHPDVVAHAATLAAAS